MNVARITRQQFETGGNFISNSSVMVAYHSSNVIIVEPFSSRKDKNWLAAYNAIMQRLKEKDLLVDAHILDNECSKEY